MIATVPRRTRVPYSRSEPLRTLILQALEANPGSSRSEVMRLTGRGWGVVVHHIRGMLRRGEIQAFNVGQRTYYHLAGEEPNLLPVARLLRTEAGAGDILRLLNRHGALSVQRISRDLGFAPKSVRRQLEQMMRAGLVAEGEDASARYELASVPLELASALRDEPPPVTRGRPDVDATTARP